MKVVDIIKKATGKRNTRKQTVSFSNEEDFYKRVEKKAYELFESRGCQPGNDWENWFEAERIVRSESK